MSNWRELYNQLEGEILKGDYPKLQKFLETVDKPKTIRVCDLHGKCGGCVFMDHSVKWAGMYECKNDFKNYKYRKKIYRARTDKACKHYHERKDIELVYKYKVGANAQELKRKSE